ncbi:hypothetical protein [Pseudobutyrivibrio sp.]
MKEIDYSKLDEACIPLVRYFNSIGLETKMCCQGHDNPFQSLFWIEFSKNVSIKDIKNFIDNHSYKIYNPKTKRIGKSELMCGWFCLRGLYNRWHYIAGSIEAADKDYEVWTNMDAGKVYWNGPMPEEFKEGIQ